MSADGPDEVLGEIGCGGAFVDNHRDRAGGARGSRCVDQGGYQQGGRDERENDLDLVTLRVGRDGQAGGADRGHRVLFFGPALGVGREKAHFAPDRATALSLERAISSPSRPTPFVGQSTDDPPGVGDARDETFGPWGRLSQLLVVLDLDAAEDGERVDPESGCVVGE